jgi:hypothetical protein
MKKAIYGATAAIALFAAGAASAATVSVTGFGTVADAVAAQNAFLAGTEARGSEDFEGFTAGTKLVPGSATPLNSGIGLITAVAGGNPGSTAINPLTEAVVRSASAPGTTETGRRYDADDTPNSTNYLDSNDNSAIKIAVSGIGMFDRISFMLTDIDDVGKIMFQLLVDGTQVYATPSDAVLSQQNGRLLLATISLPDLVNNLELHMSIDSGDGFGFDGAKIHATPLPAPALMLLGGIAAFAAVRRKRKSA